MADAVIALKNKMLYRVSAGASVLRKRSAKQNARLLKQKAPVAIGRLERYVADWERENKSAMPPAAPLPPATGKKVAVIGSGPAGLTAAADLAKKGHSVTIFEALHVGGGVLMYGIPEFRLPKEIVQNEVNFVKSLGVELVLDAVIGKMRYYR